MPSGQIVQIATMLVVLVGASAAALLCDALRTENERLRQLNLQLRTRRDEEQRRAAMVFDELKRTSRGHSEASLPPVGRGAKAERLFSPSRMERSQIAHGAADAGETLEEARQLARQLLAATAAEERAKPVAMAPRRNWGLLLQTARAAAHAPTGFRHKGELIPFESLQNHQESAARFAQR